MPQTAREGVEIADTTDRYRVRRSGAGLEKEPQLLTFHHVSAT
jgi:hypothetical protein